MFRNLRNIASRWIASASEGDSNCRTIGEAKAWLREGGMLAIFPAGEVSQWQLPQAQISDPRWNDTAVRLIRETGASALPVYFCGRNSMGFHLFGMIHPKLRAAFLLQEFLQQEGRKVEVRVGSVIPGDAVAGIADDQEATEYLRWRTYLLARRKRAEIPSSLAAWPLGCAIETFGEGAAAGGRCRATRNCWRRNWSNWERSVAWRKAATWRFIWCKANEAPTNAAGVGASA